MKYFTIDELCASDIAERKKIDNTPNADARLRMQRLIEQLLDPIRAAWGGPITVNSGYRCPELNRAVGGVATSQHLKGEAADITVGSAGDNKRLFDKIVELQKAGKIAFDQLIDESNYAWVHVSYRSGKNRNQILHL
ncbi:D-Ala-D-Ala carboxypeptidase family metallohydrolase [Millionella massiliensis]|uniref:D-Ala-D-Ala carboxypeptidase family metallohydrolase n=1 Tax=Millionella massiliensis TaxID=1871023 RepID=UPI0008DA8D9F|nr:D-Ala-D-Ala carboxypeptidase family metallohydrolase [Millionella massiliensis]